MKEKNIKIGDEYRFLVKDASGLASARGRCKVLSLPESKPPHLMNAMIIKSESPGLYAGDERLFIAADLLSINTHGGNRRELLPEQRRKMWSGKLDPETIELLKKNGGKSKGKAIDRAVKALFAPS